MSIVRKNIVLTPEKYDGNPTQKGIVTLSLDTNFVSGCLRTYNLANTNNLILGISVCNKIYKFNIPQNVTTFNFDFNCQQTQFDKISCVVIDINQNRASTLLIGSTETTSIYTQDIIDFLFETQKIDNTNNTLEDLNNKNNELLNSDDLAQENILQNKNVDNENEKLNIPEDTEINEIENYIDDLTCNETCEKCKNCMYKKYFYCESKNDIETLSNKTTIKSDKENTSFNENIQDIDQNKPQDNFDTNLKIEESVKNTFPFYDGLKHQFNTLLNNNPHDNVLEDILPNSKFVKIEKENGSHYVLGIVYDENLNPLYLCYGVPAKNKDDAPFNLDNFYSFLPIDVEDNNGAGYYMTYQSAETGENVKVTLV